MGNGDFHLRLGVILSCLIISKLSILVGCHKTEINELGELESEVGLI